MSRLIERMIRPSLHGGFTDHSLSKQPIQSGDRTLNYSRDCRTRSSRFTTVNPKIMNLNLDIKRCVDGIDKLWATVNSLLNPGMRNDRTVINRKMCTCNFNRQLIELSRVIAQKGGSYIIFILSESRSYYYNLQMSSTTNNWI